MALLLLVAIVIASFLVIARFWWRRRGRSLWSQTWDQFSWLSARLGGRDGFGCQLAGWSVNAVYHGAAGAGIRWSLLSN